MWLHRLADADASCGGKAVGLARLIAAGLPVPEGFVIDGGAFRHIVGDLDPASDEIGHTLGEAAQRIMTTELPAELVSEVESRAANLGLVAVRSSATIEDGEAGAAAGVFSSRTAVTTPDVWAAIRAVWSSALTPLAVKYARRRRGRISIGVIVQAFVPGEVATVYTRSIGTPASSTMVIQRGTDLELSMPRDAAAPTRRPLPARFEELRTLALAAETAIDASDGADVEIVEQPVLAPGGPSARHWVVQARPMVHRVPTVLRRPAPPSVTAALVADGRRWTWDVAHNPDPLSPAQAGLVERVERAEIAPWSMRVCSGFLYTTPFDSKPATAPTTVEALGARVRELEGQMELALTGPRTTGPLDDQRATTGGSLALAAAIDRYLAFYAIWSIELAPLISALRRSLSLEQLVGARPSAVEMTLLAAARGALDEASVLARIGVMAPAWDVAVPTFAERPQLVRDAIARAKAIVANETTANATPPTGSTTSDSTSTGSPAADTADRDLACAAADLAERDDVWFARAQWIVRAAILERARELEIDTDDAFWIPLDDLAFATNLDAVDAHRLAAGARAMTARAATWAMPIVVGGTDAEAAEPRRALTGVGTGPRITGRVVRLDSLAHVISVTATDVVVTRAVTPALAVLVIGCAALISETGGLLDHGAALARELGIPCVVGCEGAWALSDGMVVTVDGDAGAVEVRAG